jgi:hypothetical protein
MSEGEDASTLLDPNEATGLRLVRSDHHSQRSGGEEARHAGDALDVRDDLVSAAGPPASLCTSPCAMPRQSSDRPGRAWRGPCGSQTGGQCLHSEINGDRVPPTIAVSRRSSQWRAAKPGSLR